MPDTIQLNRIENGWLVAYPESAKVVHPNQKGFGTQGEQPKMYAHYCADLAEVGAYLLTLEH